MTQSTKQDQSLRCPWILEGKALFDGWLNALISSQESPALRSQLTNGLFPGRRIRPALLIKLASASRDVSADALIVELFHASSIIVDDILDGDDGRREIANSILKVGPDAVLSSHFVASVAWELALQGNNRASEVQGAYRRMCMGEFCDIFGSRPREDWKELYQNQVLEKTTPLFELAFIWGLEDQKNVLPLQARDLGNRLGGLFQMSNDIFDGTSVARVQRNRDNYKYPLSVTLPLACFLDSSHSSPLKKQILNGEDRQVLLREEIEELDLAIAESGSLEEATGIFRGAVISFRHSIDEFEHLRPWLDPFLQELEDCSIWTKDYELMRADDSAAGS